jgi:UDP-N-acetylmuramyl tripeptide synthase
VRLQPGAIGSLAADLPDGTLVLSATNGKTTTARLLTDCIRADGRRLVTNPSGANLASGVATALLGMNAPTTDIGVFEVDEAALPDVAAQLNPRVVLLMNLFRDQLDRYGELEELARRWQLMISALSPGTRVLLNADDPAVAALGAAAPNAHYFGITDPMPGLPQLPHAADSKRCRACGAPLGYDVVYLGHLGHWSCPQCGARRPEPEVAARLVRLRGLDGFDVVVDTPLGPVSASIALPGLHNAYNATAAVAAATTLEIPPATIGRALADTRAAFGRAERVNVNGTELVLLLVKNPAGANETIRTLLLDAEPLDVLLALNDRTADGRDVSWIWDMDIEPLLPQIRTATVSGDRAHDMALRLRYAGLDPRRMRVVPRLDDAIDQAIASCPAGRPVYLLPTYTAMLELRRGLVRRGAARAFWHDG